MFFLTITESPVSVGKMINQIGSDGYFEPFNTIQNQKAQLTVKRISSVDGFQGSVGFIRITRLAERKKIAA